METTDHWRSRALDKVNDDQWSPTTTINHFEKNDQLRYQECVFGYRLNIGRAIDRPLGVPVSMGSLFQSLITLFLLLEEMQLSLRYSLFLEPIQDQI